jgi:hypothetical protein
MKTILSITSLLFLLLASGCGYKEGVQTASQKSYLYFSGNVSDIKVSVDDAVEFSVLAGEKHQYAITPGKHVIKIYKGDHLLVIREVFISDGVAKEIEVK